MAKEIWKVIMPKRGSLDFLIQHIHKYYTECIDVVITKEELSVLEKLKTRLTTLNLGEDLQFRHHKFRPTLYQTYLSLTLPHTRQLEWPQRSGGPQGNESPETGRIGRGRTARQNARDLICKEVLLDHMGQVQYDEKILDFGSNSCFLYAHCHRLGLPGAGVMLHRTKVDKPVRYTGIVTSHIIKGPGLVKLRGEQRDRYGAAVESVFSELDRALTELRIEKQFHQLDSHFSDTSSTQDSAV